MYPSVPAALVALALALPAVAQAGTPPVTTFTLDNGLEVVVIEDHRAPIVTQMLWYRVGAADEPPGQSGIAHFVEHLMFKGTPNNPEGAFSRAVAREGGTDNAFTSYDFTGYFQRIAADRLELVMALEADRMVNLDPPLASVLSERDVVIEERRQVVESTPAGVFAEHRRAAQFLNHPYGRPVIGWMHEIEQYDLDMAMAFYRAHYAPNNAILIVAGAVDPEAVRALAEIHYGPIPANPDIAPRIRPQEPPHLTPRRLSYRDDRVRNPYVIRTHLAPQRISGAQEEAAAIAMLAEILGGSGITSVMAQELELAEGIALDTGAFYSGVSLDPTTFTIYVMPQPGISLEEAEARMDALIADFIENGPEQAALDRAKARLRAAEIYAADNQQGLARRYGAALTSGLTVEDVHAWPEILQAVTVADVQAAARTVFVPDYSVTGWLLGPEDAIPDPAAATGVPADTTEVSQ